MLLITSQDSKILPNSG